MKFNRRVKLEFHGTKLTIDAGWLAYRALDEALGFIAMVESKLIDLRKGKITHHELISLLRQSIYSRLGRYENTNDVARLRVDPAMREVVGGRAKDHNAASISQMGRFETEILMQPNNLKALMSLPGQWVDQVRQRRPLTK